MKKDKISIALSISIIVFVIAAFFFWNQSQKIVVKSEIPYEEKGFANYKVYLDKNEYYDKEYLDEGMQYISSIISHIEANFEYTASYADINDFEAYKSVLANIVITDSDDNNKVIYTKSEKIKEEKISTDDLSIKDTIPIDYKKYNSLVNEMKTKYGISADCNLEISYNVVYTSKIGEINEAKKLSLNIPLSKQMITIEKGPAISTSGLYTIHDNNSILNNIMAFCAILMILFTGADVIILIVRITNNLNKGSKYDKLIAKILKEYDSYITQAQNDNFLPDKPIITVNGFKELLDVRNNIDKTIIYTKLSDDASKFQIIDEVIYECVITRQDMWK